MAFHIAQPEITNIAQATWNTVSAQWQFWATVAGVLVSVIALAIASNGSGIAFIPLLIIVVYVVAVQNKIRTSFWRRFAEVNGWRYAEEGDPGQEQGLMFRQGHSRRISHGIEGSIDNRKFRIFNYEFSVGSGKNKKTYYYTAFAFRFNGSFPHIYLNHRRNSYSIRAGEEIPLPEEFKEKFSLSAPRKYEIEALAIFTPDILARLLDDGFPHDVEFIEQEVVIFTDGRINTFETLEKEFHQALALEDLLDEKLDRSKFQPIGDMPHHL